MIISMTDLSAPLQELLSIIKHSGYNDGESEIDKAILRVIYDEVSDRNLAQVISALNNIDNFIAMNEVYKIGSRSREDFMYFNAADQRLSELGFRVWLNE